MCGRFLQDTDVDIIISRFDVKEIPEDTSVKEELFPTDKAMVIVMDGFAKLKFMRWGFYSFSDKPLINARAETVHIKPTFRNSFLARRCLIPSTAYFEWKKVGNQKIKHKIIVEDSPIFSMAAIYCTFKNSNNQYVQAFTILTTDAVSQISEIHSRMPVIIEPKDEELWLDTSIKDIDRVRELIRPFKGNLILSS